MSLIDLDVIPYVIGGVPNSSPICYLFFWVNDLVRSVTQKKFLLHITLGTGYN